MNATTFHTILTQVLDDVYEALPVKPQRKCIVPGLIAWDGCECGALHGTINRWGITQDSLTLTPPPNASCAAPYQVATMNVSIVRCVPIPQGNQTSVSCSLLEAAAVELETDAYWVLETTLCTLAELKDEETIADFQIVQQTSVGPEGQCAGSVLQVNVWLYR